MRTTGSVVALAVLLSTVPACAQIGAIAARPGVGQAARLPVTDIASGLKEALRVGAENAVQSTGRKDGYFGNEVIRILIPKNLRTVETTLRAVGFGPKVDEFELSMNRAAERAAPEAKTIFVDAIVSISFEDARTILQGGDTAATDYLKVKTSDRLTAAFRPIVDRSMAETGVTAKYDELIGRFQALPFQKKPSLDIRTYVVGKALDGLFYVLGQEEKNIRRNPAARVTSLLQRVFGR